jgi:hemerythrin-like domain-containing protein
MSIDMKPNIAVSLFTIHKVVSRALDVAIEYAQSFSTEGYPSLRLHERFFNYIKAFISILHSHHLTEDELAFPYFRDKLPETPFEMLSAQHKEMSAALEKMRAVVARVADLSKGSEYTAEILPVMEKLKVMWHPHIQVEEKHFDIHKVGEMLPVEEHLRLMRQYGEFSQQHSGPAFLTVPFILYNLPEDMRSIMSKGMPVEVVENLVPIVWKAQWESMQPFLLP